MSNGNIALIVSGLVAILVAVGFVLAVIAGNLFLVLACIPMLIVAMAGVSEFYRTD